MAAPLPAAAPPAPSPLPPPSPASHSSGDVAAGVIICLVANLSMSLGTNVLKLAFGRRAKELEEKRAAAVASGAPPPKLPPLYTSRIWLAGFVLYKAGNLSNFAALGFAPQSLLSAVAAVQFISNVLFSRLILGAATSRRVLAGVAAIVSGVVLLVLFGSHSSVKYTPRALRNFFRGGPFVVWALALALSGGAAYAHFAAAASGEHAGEWLVRVCRLRWRAGAKLGRARLAVRGARANLARKASRRVGAQPGHRRTRSDSGDDDDDDAAAAAKDGRPLAGPASEARLIFEGYESSSLPLPNAYDSGEDEEDAEGGGGLAALAGSSEPAVTLAASRMAPLCFAAFSATVGTFSVLFSKCTATCVRAAGTRSSDGSRYNPGKDPSVYFYVVLLVLTGVFWDKQMNRALSLFPAATILPLMQVAWTLLAVLTGGIFFGEFATLHGGHAALFALGIFIMLGGVAFLVPPAAEPAGAGGAPAESGSGAADAGAASAAAPGQAPPPLPPRPTRAALLRTESGLGAPGSSSAATAGAFDAVSFSLFSVPTLKEATEEAEAEGHELPAYFRLERRMATAGEALEDATDALLAQAEATVGATLQQLRGVPRQSGAQQPPPLPPRPPPPLPPKPTAPDVEMARAPGGAAGAPLERSVSLTRRSEAARESHAMLHSISFGRTSESSAVAPQPDAK